MEIWVYVQNLITMKKKYNILYAQYEVICES